MPTAYKQVKVEDPKNTFKEQTKWVHWENGLQRADQQEELGRYYRE